MTPTNPDLLEQMAEANDATAEYIEGGNLARAGRAVSLGMPPEIVASMLRLIASTQRKLASDTREGKPIRERISTDG